MKTIREIVEERHLDRSTLLKAAQRGVFGEAARKSGDTWLIDDSAEQFKAWLSSHKPRGVPPTIEVETPEPPEWVNTRAAKHAWRVNLNWRVKAESATSGVGVEQFRALLLREAEALSTR